jgi:hypothetical protein
MAKKSKKKFKISRDDLNVAINEYLEKGGKITKLECVVPERSRTVLQESQMKSFSTPVVDQDFYSSGTGKETG